MLQQREATQAWGLSPGGPRKASAPPSVTCPGAPVFGPCSPLSPALIWRVMGCAGQTRHALGEYEDPLLLIYPLPFAIQNPTVTDGRRPQRPASNKGPFDFPIPMGSLDDSSKFVSLKLSLLGNNFKNPRTVKGSQKKGRHHHGAINNTHHKLGPFLFYVSLLADKKQLGCWWLLLALNHGGGRTFGQLLTKLGSGRGSVIISGRWLEWARPQGAPLTMGQSQGAKSRTLISLSRGSCPDLGIWQSNNAYLA